MSKIVGQARALARGYYPTNDAGNCRLVEEGEVFDLREGHEKGKWFEKVVKAKAPPKPENKNDDVA